MKKTDTLVVGQGIAGSLVAFMLHLHNIPFLVMDPGYANTCSKIAAGMFTPVSGKRKTIQPMAIQQIAYAIEIYRALEQLLKVPLLHLEDIFQVNHTVAERQEWLEKVSDKVFANYITIAATSVPGVKHTLGACSISHSGWVDCALLSSMFAQWLQQRNALLESTFVYNDLKTGKGEMEYNGITFRQIIFCEGYQAHQNPFFENEKIIPCKGDILTVQYDHPDITGIVKKNGTYLLRVHENIFKAGSTYHWNNDSSEPEVTDKQFIEGRLDDMLENNYKTIHHQSAVRPTTQHREVIAKQHPQHPGMFMLNGLGTKGILQGPWWARQLVRLCAESQMM